ncbi:MAG: HAMP domain-containing histidine kinase [Clostridiales bacterium]|nr:HAMP domain-containing histidine kinase [Clostridiales bacterium]
MKQKKRFFVPIILGFAVLYLTVMLLATFLVKLKFQEDYQRNYRQMTQQISALLAGRSAEKADADEAELLDRFKISLTYQVATITNEGKQQFSAAVYDEEGNYLWESQAVISAAEPSGIWWDDLSDYLSVEEQEEAAEFLQQYLYLIRQNVPYKYRCLIRTPAETGGLQELIIQEVEWEKGEDSVIDPLTGYSHSYQFEEETYGQTSSRVVWNWKAGAEDPDQQYYIRDADLFFPYLYQGIEEWKRWENSEYLHSFSGHLDTEQDSYTMEEYGKLFMYPTDQIPSFPSRIKVGIPVLLSMDSTRTYTVVLASESRPWQAAVDYMKYVYLAGFLLMLVCMGKILYATNRTYEQRAALEETRRDFTNAMAHELKTPLGIIRGFADNLKEHTVEAKRDYYVDQIIRQTEEMDCLVAEMIYVSRLDTEHLVLQRDEVSLAALFREQTDKFAPVLEAENITVSYDCEEDFEVEGDRDYLEKAVWNLVSNAVAYNVPGGSIHIHTEKDGCSIENTGAILEEEQLVHAFDMFYSGDKSRSARGKHMGLGLFLAGKILAIHHLNIRLENTKEGVRVVIRK